jgi:predicted PurR-regulated permease PerM
MTDPRHERERVRLLLFYTMVLLVGYLAFQVVAPFLAALAWASVFAMVLSPIATRLDRRVNNTVSATVMTLTAGVLIVGPAVLVLTILIREVTQIVVEIQQSGYAIPTPARLQEAWMELRTRSPFPLPVDLSSAIVDGLQTLASYIASKTGSVLQNIIGFLFQLFVMLFGLFYFLRDRDRMVNVIRQLLPFPEARRELVIQQTHDLVVATVGSTFAVAAIQGAMTGLALGVLGFRAPVFWGVMTSAFAVLPVGGSGLIWIPAAIWLFASGDVTRGVVLLVFGTVVIGLADNILRPLLLSGRTTMHGLLVFVSLMGGMATFGFIGLVIGPVAVATMITLVGAVMPPPPAPTMPDDGRPGAVKP